MKPTQIAIVGDRSDEVVAHRCIPRALQLAGDQQTATFEISWIGTDFVGDPTVSLANYSAVWVAPGSPYRRMEGAIGAIRWARETGRPFLGTCGGFQHALVEIARHVAKVADADHTESNPTTPQPLIVPLACSLVGQSGPITFKASSQLASIFSGEQTIETYRCNYGLNSAYRELLTQAGVLFSAFDLNGEVRGFEWPAHPFFIGTLFQPERSALLNQSHALIRAFARAATTFADGQS